VLHVQKVKGLGGSERHLLDLLPALAREGHEVRMYIATTGEADRFLVELQRRGVDTRAVPAGPHVNPLLFARLSAEVRRYQPDLVHTHLLHADLHGQPAARMWGVPAVSSVHSAHKFYRRQPVRLVGTAACRLATRTITISEHVRRFAVDVGLNRPGAIRVVPYGVDAGDWEVSGEQRGRAREALGLGEGDVAVAMAARMVSDKGHDVLLDAFDKAVSSASQLRLLIAGDGPLEGAIRARAARHPADRIRILGFVDDMHALFAASDIVVFPTMPALSEGFGLVALEAGASGLPVVATDVGALPEVVTHLQTGIVIPPGDPDALAKALISLLRDPSLRRRLGRAAAERAKARFGLDGMVARTLAVYDEVLAIRGN
jgi:glycosyltransferase involved in cell wall biosynthesis